MINLEKIEKFRKDNKFANVYGFILFTSTHSNVVKVLNDDFYWRGFDEISKNWIIFSIKPEIGKYEYPSLPSGFLGMMVPIWKEPKANTKMIELFEIETTKKLPLFVAFIVKNEKQIDKITYQLKDDNLDNARNSIKSIIESITSVVDLILPEYYDTENVFRNVKQEIESKITIEKIKKVINLYKWLKELAP